MKKPSRPQLQATPVEPAPGAGPTGIGDLGSSIGPTGTGGLDAALALRTTPATGQEHATLAAAERLKEELERIMPMDAPVADWTTQNANEVISTLRDFVGGMMNTPLGDESELRIVVLHPVAGLLGELSAALGELKHGVTDPRLRALNTGSAALKHSETVKIVTLLDFVATVRERQGTTWREAQAQITSLIENDEYYRIGAKPVTAKRLAAWKKSFRAKS